MVRYLLSLLVLGGLACGPTIILPEDSFGETGANDGGRPATGGVDGMTTVPPPPDDGSPGEGPSPDPDTSPGETSIGPSETTSFDTTEDDGAFLIQPDHPQWPPSCDLLDDDCPDGEKCTLYSQTGSGLGATRCVPVVPDPDAVGEPCAVLGEPDDGFDSCAQGSMCWGASDELTGDCVAFCQGSYDNLTCADACTTCLASSGPLALCLPECDAIAQDCQKDYACYPWYDTFACMPDESAGIGQAGQPCEYINGCAPGSFCLDPETYPSPACEDADGCCTPTCIVGDPNSCAGALEGSTCVAWFDDPKPDGCGTGPDIGVCVIE